MSADFLVISDNRVIHKIPVSEIEHVESKGMRSFIYISNGEMYTCSKNMGAICKMLCVSNIFYRTATSFAVNVTKIAKVKKEKSAVVIMLNGAIIPIAKRRKSDFFKRYLDNSRL